LAVPGQSAVAQAADVVVPEADAVLLQPQTITAATETAATPSDVPSCIIAPADTAFGHVTALSVTRLPGSPGNRIDNMGSDSISSHSHNSNRVHGDASRDLDVMGNMSDGRTSAENNTGVPSSNAACHNRVASKAPEAAAEGEQQQQLQDVMSNNGQQVVSSEPDRADVSLPENVKVAHRCGFHLFASASECCCNCLLEPTGASYYLTITSGSWLVWLLWVPCVIKYRYCGLYYLYCVNVQCRCCVLYNARYAASTSDCCEAGDSLPY